MLRVFLIGLFFVVMTPLLITLQWLLDKLGLPGWGFIATRYYRVLCLLLAIRVHIAGRPVRERAVLFVSNHVSWVDIVVIGSIVPVAFVAKQEVRRWPLIGITAKIQRTVFVDRGRRHKVADAVDAIVARLKGGTSVVLFAEGTSSDGNRILPFRSALLGAVEHAALHGAAGDLMIQPMSICYTRQHGIPMGRQHRPLVAWYGDLDFLPHIRDFITRGAVDAVVSYGEPTRPAAAEDRKALTRRLENAIRRLAAASLGGRAPAACAGEPPISRAALKSL
jgi:1-acyl-sn-glycerol-3-phosphate acyltransferase